MFCSPKRHIKEFVKSGKLKEFMDKKGICKKKNKITKRDSSFHL